MQIPRGARGDGGGRDVWLKLAGDGDRAVVAFLGEPVGREVVFEGNHYVSCTAAHRAAGAEVKFRLGVNVAVLAPRAVKVFEMGVSTFRDLVALRGKLGFETWAFELRREGQPKDQQTRYHVLPERPLADEELAWLGKEAVTARHDLRALYERDAARGGATARDGQAEAAARFGRLPAAAQGQVLTTLGVSRLGDLDAVHLPKALEVIATAAAGGSTGAPSGKRTISDEVARALVTELRRLSQEGVSAWLKHCGIARVRELAIDRLPDARAFLALLVKEHGGAAAPPATDPFA